MLFFLFFSVTVVQALYILAPCAFWCSKNNKELRNNELSPCFYHEALHVLEPLTEARRQATDLLSINVTSLRNLQCFTFCRLEANERF